MLTYDLKKSPGVPLYEALYRQLRRDILTGALPAGTKLPSKRALAANLDVSKITVETAYNQLLSEGYVRSVEKVGYFVENVARIAPAPVPRTEAEPEQPTARPAQFPFSVWSRLQRQVVLDQGEGLLGQCPQMGVWELRAAICAHLAQFRGMQVSPEQVCIGAGTDFLYNLVVQLLGREKTYAVEEPGYEKIRKIYESGGVRTVCAPMDDCGVTVAGLESVQVLHLSPTHHFPTGLVTPPARRQQLLQWASAAPDRYIVEDDYDSEFRSHPLPAMMSLDSGGRVIYMNFFTKTLAPSIRIGYMVLPMELAAQLRTRLGFYSCTVSGLEQYTLARFLSEGHFEKHINRMRKFYKNRRRELLDLLEKSPLSRYLTVQEQQAGLHFLIKVDAPLSDRELEQRCAQAGLPLRSLGSYYLGDVPREVEKTLVVRYDLLTPAQLSRGLQQLEQTWLA